MGFNPFRFRSKDFIDRSLAKRQRNQGDVGRAQKIPRTKSVGTERGAPSLVSELEAALIPKKKSGKGYGGQKKWIVGGPVVDEDWKAYPLAWDFLKGVLARLS